MKELLTVIVPAAGAGRRMGLGKNKAFVTLGGMPLLVLCLKMLAETRMVQRIIVVVRDWEIAETEKMLQDYQSRCFPGIDWQVTAGGKERQDSVANGLALVTDESGYVAVHDGARPFAGTDVFSRTFAKAKETALLYPHRTGPLYALCRRRRFLRFMCCAKDMSI